MNIVFVGTSKFAREILTTLNQHHNIVGVFCRPDRPYGRGKVIKSCAVQQYAKSQNLLIFQPEKITATDANKIHKLSAEVMIVVAYGQILPAEVLNITTYGSINIHASLLPKLRGASPIQYAILNGDKTTGITTIKMDEGLDSGDILSSKTCSITAIDTTQTLSDKLLILAQSTIIEVLVKLPILVPKPQDKNTITYTKKITKQQAWIDWNKTSSEIDRQIRAFNPYPIAQTLVDLKHKASGKTLKKQTLRIFKAPLGANEKTLTITQTKTELIIKGLSLKQVQLASKNVIDISAFNNNYQLLSLASANV